MSSSSSRGAARLSRAAHATTYDWFTQIAYTPESGGPEAFAGVRQLSPAYDVHGFGAVGYYLVTLLDGFGQPAAGSCCRRSFNSR